MAATTRKVRKAKARKRRGKKAVGKRSKSIKKVTKSARPPRAKRSARADNPIEVALAAFAHEVRTPLTGILAVSDLLATSELDERERRWVDTIKTSAEHLAALATLFVDAARSSHGGLGLRRDFFDLRTLARIAGDSLSGRATAKGLQSSVTIADDLPEFAIGDRVRLRAALENLIDNAVKFTARGDVGLVVTVKRATNGKVAVTFAVSDSGIGMSFDEIRRLFRPFSQANLSIASRFGGAGLGLSSVKQIARAMGGDITAATRAAGGTTFTLTVTLQNAGQSADGIAAPGERPDDNDNTRGLRILSVEDNPFGRVVLNAILTELGHSAEFVGRGEVAAERVAQGNFDVVLMDMVLPGIDGIEAIRQVRALPGDQRRVAVVVVSGRDSDETRAMAAGADAFLVKPVSPRSVAATLLAATRRVAAANS